MKIYLFLLSFILLFLSCSKKTKTDIGEVYHSDIDCLKEIEKAKSDFSQNRKTYFLFLALNGSIDDYDKIISNLKEEGITAKLETVSCIYIENILSNCYEKQMNFMMTKQIGEEKLECIILNAKKEFVLESHLKIKTFPDAKIVDSLRQGIKMNYPKQYYFSKTVKDVSYYYPIFEIKDKILDLGDLAWSSNDTYSDKYGRNQIFDSYLKSQIENYLKKEIPKLNLDDGTYSVLIKLD